MPELADGRAPRRQGGGNPMPRICLIDRSDPASLRARRTAKPPGGPALVVATPRQAYQYGPTAGTADHFSRPASTWFKGIRSGRSSRLSVLRLPLTCASVYRTINFQGMSRSRFSNAERTSVGGAGGISEPGDSERAAGTVTLGNGRESTGATTGARRKSKCGICRQPRE